MLPTIELIGAPFDLSGSVLGSRLGPIALHLVGLPSVLASLGYSVKDFGDAFPVCNEVPRDMASRYGQAIAAYTQVKSVVQGSLAGNALPVVLGGDHGVAFGSVSAALDHTGGDLAVLWIDAHMDINTPATTPSGNLHGMPLAMLSGYEDLAASPHDGLDGAWAQAEQEFGPKNLLRAKNIAWIGLRDVDEGEAATASRLKGSFVTTMQDIDRDGVNVVLEKFGKWLWATGCRNIWISFDVDVIDPFHAPGTGTAVRGGLTYREGQLLAEILYEKVVAAGSPYRLVGVDLVEVNPMQDKKGETALTTMKWAEALFGRTILRRRVM